MRFLLAALFVWLAWGAVKSTPRGRALVRAVRGAFGPKPEVPTTDDDARRELGVARTASEDDVRKAYRALVKKHHPDVAPEPERAAAELKMRRLQAAYDRLLRRD